MRAERQAGGDVVLHHLLAEGHLRQLCGVLDDALAVHVAGEERQRLFRRDGARGPERVAARQVERGEGVGLRQHPQDTGGGAGAAPDILDRSVAVAAGGGDPVRLLLRRGLDLAEPQAQREARRAAPAPSCSPSSWR